MNKVKKRILCMLLCVVLLASLLPAAFADDVIADETAVAGNTVIFTYAVDHGVTNGATLTINFTFDHEKLELKSVTPYDDVVGVTAVSFTSDDIALANTKGIFGASWVDPYLNINVPAGTDVLKATFVSKTEEAEKPSVTVVESKATTVDETDLSKVVILLDDTVAEEATIEILEGILGDVDGDGIVDSWDAYLIQCYEVGLDDGSELNLAMGDVDGDGFVDSWDAYLIQCYEVGLIDNFD